VKATQRDFRNVAPRAAQQCSIFFFCGPDEAGASAAASDLIASLPDAGERVELSGGALRKDPVLLGDEARSTSLFGDKRHIFVRANGDEAHDGVNALIETAEAGAGDAAPVIIVATSATDKSRTAKLLEKRKDALVAMFWPPDLGSVTGSVRVMADAAGLRLGGDLAERIARAANLDVRLAQSEITKLAIYCDASQQAPQSVNAEDLDAIMREHSMSPVGLLLALERRASQLARIRAHLGNRGSFDQLGKGEKAMLGIFFREEREIRQQYACWPAPKLDRLMQRLMAAHRALLANSQMAETLLAQELAAIVRFAAPRTRSR